MGVSFLYFAYEDDALHFSLPLFSRSIKLVKKRKKTDHIGDTKHIINMYIDTEGLFFSSNAPILAIAKPTQLMISPK